MHIVTAANSNLNYPKLVDKCVKAAEALGYPVLLYDLGGLGKGDPIYSLGDTNQILTCWQKPRVMLDALGKIPVDSLLVWLDADAWVIRSLDEMDDGSYDVGLLIRDGFRLRYEVEGPEQEFRAPNPGSEFSQKINSGTVFLYNNARARRFLRDWIAKLPEKPLRGRKSLWKYGDQRFLNDLLIEYYTSEYYMREFGTKLEDKTLLYHNVRLRFVKTHNYSNYEIQPGDEIPESVKILHFKGETLR
jgi:hypothetical protein